MGGRKGEMTGIYLNPKICKKCGGKCCKAIPGGALPEDFGEPLFDNLKQAFATGNWAIDWWESDPTGQDKIDCGYFIRPKVKGVNKIYDPSWGGECIFLEDGVGCKLLPHERPANCRLTEPKVNGKCIVHGASKKDVAIAWIPFHNIIHEVAQWVEGKI